MRPNGLHLALGRAANPNSPPSAGLALHLRADRGLYTGGATGFTRNDKCCLKITDAAQTGLDPDANSLTFEVWFRCDSLPDVGVLICKDNATAGYEAYLNTNGSVTVTYGDGTHRIFPTSAAGVVVVGTIYQLVYVADRAAGTVKVWLNGTEVISADASSITGNVATATDFCLGSNNNAYAFDGAMQAVSVWSRALTAAERTTLYNNRNPVKHADFTAGLLIGLVSRWDLDENLIDATHPAEDSHGSNDLTFTPATISSATTWTNHASKTWDICTILENGVDLQVNGDGSPDVCIAHQQALLTSGHAYAYDYTAAQTSGPNLLVGYTTTENSSTSGGWYGAATDGANSGTFTATASNGYAVIACANTSAYSWTINALQIKATRLYPANGFQTAIASDVSGNGNHATLTGFSAAQQETAWQPRGATGHALTFDGAANYGKVAHASALNAYPLTIAGWIKTTTVARTIFNKYRNSTANGYWLSIDATGHLASGYYGASSYCDSPTAVSTGVVTDGAWHHVGFTLDATGITYYIDGAASGTDAPWNSTPSATTTTTDITLACAQLVDGSTFSYFPAQMADWRLYDSALTPAQMAELYTLDEDEEVAGLTPVAHWTFEDGPAPAVADGDPLLGWESTEGNRRLFIQPTIAARPTWIAAGINGRPVIRFDGIDDYLYSAAHLSGTTGTIAIFGKLRAGPIDTQYTLSQAESDTRYFTVAPADAPAKKLAYNATNASDADYLQGNTTNADDTPFLAVWATDGTTVQAYLTGIAQTLTAVVGANDGDWFDKIPSPTQCAIGCLLRSTAAYFSAIDLAELRVYDRVLTATELDRLLRYAEARYGIAP